MKAYPIKQDGKCDFSDFDLAVGVQWAGLSVPKLLIISAGGNLAWSFLVQLW